MIYYEIDKSCYCPVKITPENHVLSIGGFYSETVKLSITCVTLRILQILSVFVFVK